VGTWTIQPVQRDGEAQMATHFLFRSGGRLSPAPSVFVLTLVERCQKLTSRAQLDGRRELAPGARLRAELTSLAEWRCQTLWV
jgi:hypothetical protein